MTSEIFVQKRNGRGKEPLNIDKIHSMVGYATEDITGVSASHVEMNSGIQFYDGIDTEDIQQILIKSANDLISLDNPNYQYVAARLLLFSLNEFFYLGLSSVCLSPLKIAANSKISLDSLNTLWKAPSGTGITSPCFTSNFASSICIMP